jgi:hypothetical protein
MRWSETGAGARTLAPVGFNQLLTMARIACRSDADRDRAFRLRPRASVSADVGATGSLIVVFPFGAYLLFGSTTPL